MRYEDLRDMTPEAKQARDESMRAGMRNMTAEDQHRVYGAGLMNSAVQVEKSNSMRRALDAMAVDVVPLTRWQRLKLWLRARHDPR